MGVRTAEYQSAIAVFGSPFWGPKGGRVWRGALLTQRQLEIVGRLFELEPAPSYPRRGAEQVSELAGAQAFRLDLGDDVQESVPAPSGPPSVEIPLEGGTDRLGTLHLFGPMTEEQRQLAQWGGRALARALRYAKRLDGGTAQRTVEDVNAMLERTPLTPRERDVVGRLLSGASTRQIAESTGLTVATVNTYLKRIFAKLGVHSRVELVARVTGTRGVIPSTPPPSPGDDSAQP